MQTSPRLLIMIVSSDQGDYEYIGWLSNQHKVNIFQANADWLVSAHIIKSMLIHSEQYTYYFLKDLYSVVNVFFSNWYGSNLFWFDIWNEKDNLTIIIFKKVWCGRVIWINCQKQYGNVLTYHISGFITYEKAIL